MWSGINDCVYAEHGVRSCRPHLHRACGQVLLTTFTQSSLVRYYMECSGLADPIHTEQSGQVFLPTFTQSSLVRYYMECSGLVDCLYTDTLSFVPTTAGDIQGM